MRLSFPHSDISAVLPALMLYVGALLVTSGRYTFSKMLQVFSIIIFTVTFASALMNYRTSRLLVFLRSHIKD